MTFAPVEAVESTSVVACRYVSVHRSIAIEPKKPHKGFVFLGNEQNGWGYGGGEKDRGGAMPRKSKIA